MANAGSPAPGSRPPGTTNLKVVRFDCNPIIRPELLPGDDGANINGPSLLLVPDWIEKPLGRYYLYFANHGGSYIRLAYADHLSGPWRIYAPGVLSLKDAPGCRGHVASPDVVAVPELNEVRMYFHGPAREGKNQLTFVARSRDGLHFQASGTPLCPFYFRAFRHHGVWYGMSKGGLLWRSEDGLVAFEEGPNPMPCARKRDRPMYNEPGARHVAIQQTAEALWVYFSSIGDAPERIQRCRIQLTPNWRTWRASPPEIRTAEKRM